MRWSNSVLMVVVALVVGASFGYLVPRSATGEETRSWLPMIFEKGMEVFMGTSHTYVAREPGFVSEGNCRLSGLARFLPSASDDDQVVRLGYAIDLAAPATPPEAPLHLFSSYNVQFSFALLDADGFPVHYVRTATQRLNPSESCIFQGIVEQPIPCDIARRTEKIECRLCFEGIEIP